MHPLDPTSGASPSALLTTNTIKSLLLLADKYNMQVGAFEFVRLPEASCKPFKA